MRMGNMLTVRRAVPVYAGPEAGFCEYMTGGLIVVLGETGRNIGAGMTGGIAFIIDEKNKLDLRMNNEIVELHHLNSTNQEQTLKDLIIEYHQSTKSLKAKKILSDMQNKFFQNLLIC